MPVDYFRHALIGTAAGQTIVNVLWYYQPIRQNTPAVDVIAFANEWASTLAQAFVTPMPTQYTLVRTETQMYDVEWNPTLSTPHIKPIGLSGGHINSLMGQSPYVVLNFALDYSFADVPPGHGPVRRSYLAYGPLPEQAVNDNHEFVPGFYQIGQITDLLAMLVTGVQDGLWDSEAVAIRVGTTNLANNGGPDPFHRRSWAKAIGASTRLITSDRASRIPS